MTECPTVETDAQFMAAIQAKQAQGKKVLLSIGGQNGEVQLTTTAARDTFVSSVSAIIDRYGLNGLDIDFEGQSLRLNAGDSDFRSPTTPMIVNLISALKTLKARYGAGFVLTMAPETFFVQLGYQFYGGTCSGCDTRAGAFLPVIYAMRNDLTVLHVQDYNSGPDHRPGQRLPHDGRRRLQHRDDRHARRRLPGREHRHHVPAAAPGPDRVRHARRSRARATATPRRPSSSRPSTAWSRASTAAGTRSAAAPSRTCVA